MPENVGSPAIGVVAAVTLQVGDEVGRRLAGSLGAVVATRAGAGHAAMIETGWQPGVCRVTIVALGAGLYMLHGLAGGCGTVVAL